MRNNKRNRVITAICVFLIVITTFTSFTAFADTKAGIVSIKANSVTTTIDDVKKAANEGYSSIYLKKSNSSIPSYSMYVWVYDTTRSTTLSNKYAFVCNSTSTGHWIKYKSGVTYKVGDTVRFYGSQATSESKGLSYVVYGDKATL